jgi:hypothetical protein
LKTYCTSSAAYQQLCKRHTNETKIKGFADIDDTEIPQLRNHAIRCTLIPREAVADRVLTQLRLLMRSINTWAAHKSKIDELSLTQKGDLQIATNDKFKELEKVRMFSTNFRLLTLVWKFDTNTLQESTLASKNASSQLYRFSKNHFAPGVTAAVIESVAKAEDITRRIVEKKIMANTFRAICKGKGYFTSYDKTAYTWNKDFNDAFIRELIHPLDLLFNSKLDSVHNAYLASEIKQLAKTVTELNEELSLICGASYKPLQDILSQVPLLEDQIRHRVEDSLKSAKSQNQKMQNATLAIIEKEMQSYYLRSLNEEGKLLPFHYLSMVSIYSTSIYTNMNRYGNGFSNEKRPYQTYR